MANGSADAQELRDIDASVPHSARIWNYWLGGKDNFAADREAGDEFLAVYPGQRDKARADTAISGKALMAWSPAARSTAKLSLPPSQ